jgi:hypothetical protein
MKDYKKYAKAKHWVELKELGYVYTSMGKLNSLERRAHAFAEKCCNEDISEATEERQNKKFTEEAKELFGGELPKGFFINGDPRGYALKLDDEAYSRDPRAIDKMPVTYTDMGGYGILAPDWN